MAEQLLDVKAALIGARVVDTDIECYWRPKDG